MKFLRGELSPGKLYFLAGGTAIGNGIVITNWTHIVWYDPFLFFCGIMMVITAWRVK